MEWSTARPDWEERIVARKSLLPCGPLFPDEAEDAMETFAGLRLVDVAGGPTINDACLRWVLDFARVFFGSYDNQTGRRLIREFFLLVAKKNSKSSIAAAIMLTALVRNWRDNADYLIVAPTIEVAENAFKPASGMVKADEELDKILRVHPTHRKITHQNTGATLKVIAADKDTVSGKNASGVFIDELWLFGGRPNAENLLREATGGMATRQEGFVIYATTQSDTAPAGIFKQKLDYFRDVRDGRIVDPKSLGVLYEFPKEMVEREEYLDSSNFYIPNPNLGKSVDEPWLVDELVKAKRAGLSSLVGFAAKNLNIEIGIGLGANRWPGAEFWLRQGDPGLTLEAILERSEVVVVGIDGGGLDDLFGLIVLGRDKETKDWLAWAHAWCHKGVLQRRQSIAPILLDFKQKEELTIVDDKLDDLSSIVEIIGDINDRGLLACVSIDPYGIGEFVDALGEIGITEADKRIRGAPQGLAMMNAIKTAERKLANGTLRHAGQALMAWAVGNLKIEPLATGIRATKANAGDAKIDPVMALFDAVTVMMQNPGSTVSVYEDEDVIV